MTGTIGGRSSSAVRHGGSPDRLTGHLVGDGSRNAAGVGNEGEVLPTRGPGGDRDCLALPGVAARRHGGRVGPFLDAGEGIEPGAVGEDRAAGEGDRRSGDRLVRARVRHGPRDRSWIRCQREIPDRGPTRQDRYRLRLCGVVDGARRQAGGPLRNARERVLAMGIGGRRAAAVADGGAAQRKIGRGIGHGARDGPGVRRQREVQCRPSARCHGQRRALAAIAGRGRRHRDHALRDVAQAVDALGVAGGRPT